MLDQALFMALKGRGMQGAPAQSQSDHVAPSAPAPGSPPGAGSPLFNLLRTGPDAQVAETSPGGSEAEADMKRHFGPIAPLPTPIPSPKPRA